MYDSLYTEHWHITYAKYTQIEKITYSRRASLVGLYKSEMKRNLH